MSQRDATLTFWLTVSFSLFFIALILFVLFKDGDDNHDPVSTPQAAAPTLTPTFRPVLFPSPTRSVPVGMPPVTTFSTATPFDGVILPSCAVHTEWTPYTVMVGDTLAVIAAEIGSTIEAIASGNCLTDPNSIMEGQVLYLPPANSAPAAYAALVIEPGIWDGMTYLLQGDTSVEIRVAQLPANTVSVMFFRTPQGSNTTPILIGRDNNLNDGASLNWVVPASSTGLISARAILLDGSHVPVKPVNYISGS